MNNNINGLSGIKVAHTNINGIRNKLDSLGAELSDYDIICIAETKLNNTYETSKLELAGFKEPYRKDRDVNNGGGLLIYVKSNIHSIRRNDLEDQFCENIWLEIRSSNKKFLLGLYYRPPNSTSDYWDYFENNIELVSDLNCDLLILGDFNQDMLKTNTNNHLKQIMSKFSLTNLINEPTRITPTSETCLDLILTNHKSIITTYEVLAPFHSDHCTVAAEVTFKTYKSLSYKKTLWKYEQADLESIKYKLETTNWSFINTLENMNIINETFTKNLLDICNECIPKVTLTVRPNDKPWMTNEIRRIMRQRDRLYTKAKSKNNETQWHNYRLKRNEVIDEIRKAKKKYFQSLQDQLACENLSPNKWYKIAKEISKTKNKNDPSPPLVNNGITNIHPFDKAEILNKHFSEISSIENEPQLPDQTVPDFNLSNIIISEQDVGDQIQMLNANKPGGPDEIMPRLIKMTGKHLIKPLTLIYNKSIELGQVPCQWKMSNISAIFKGKGDEYNPSNYRPISITSCLGKILEKIIFKYLYNYLQEYEILTKYQSGFRPHDSTVNQLLEIYHIIIENLDKGKEIKFIFCDVSKAFDKVWHAGLLYKLKKYGVNGNILRWFSSYLSERKQRVFNEGFYSTWKDTLAGVPQGSVLGPYLFLLYVNDIVDNIKSNIRLFADDTSLFTVIDNTDSLNVLTEDLLNIARWAQDWCIILNPSKTKSMTFTRKKSNNIASDILFDNQTITDEASHTHLGITLSSDATWGEHINTIYDKAACRLNTLRMLKYDLDRKSLIRFYLSFIRPILEYGNIIWDGCNKQQSDLLESIQLDAARIITGLRRGTSHSILYDELGWCSLSIRRKNSKLIHFYKILNYETPQYINDILNRYNTYQTNYTLRNQNLRYPTPRTTSFQNSFFISTIDAWNNIDPALNNATSLYSFKRILKNRLPQPPKHYSYGKRKDNIIICQLRNSKSQLNLHLYDDHLADSPSCTCGAAVESTHHFLLECPNYRDQRQELINALQDHPHIYETMTLSTDNLLKGSLNLSFEDNCTILNNVSTFIELTSRFDQN